VGQRSTDRGHAVELSRTAFYPTSGGQPHDVGTLDGAQVVDVREEDDRVLHIVSAPVAGYVQGIIDWTRRFDHMQQHTGQHILSQAALRTAGAQTRSVHFGGETATLDLDRADFSRAEAETLEDLANGVVFEDRAVLVREVDEADLPALGLRRPAKRTGTIRIVEVEDFDRSACGGTHVRRTGEVGAIVVRRWERHRGGVRLEFVCGWRALRDYRRTRALLSDLAASLTVGDADVSEAVARLSAQLRARERTLEDLRARMLGREAADLLATAEGEPKLVAAVVPHAPEEAAALAGALVASAPCVAIIGSAEGRLVLARSADVPLDASAVLRQALGPYGGRGGGRPEFAQGAVPAERIAEAVQAARALVQRPGPGG
jgi:alanyl-tRNA synthetase